MIRDVKVPDPPRAAEKLLEIMHTDGDRFTHLGDFEEVYRVVFEENGPKASRLWYWAQVFRSLPGFLMNRMYWNLSMFRNYVVIALRNMIKNRWFSLIDIFGLFSGLAVIIACLGLLSLASFSALIIAFLTVGSQTLRAALANPVDALRC